MSRGIKTITDLYRNWYDGLAGGYPVETLERQWGTKWREDQKEPAQHDHRNRTQRRRRKMLPAQQVFAPSFRA
ncbi:hypothetical protein [Absidia glauca]|uniref:Transcription activator GCR1-like domain-containing protein n=1 Tax=Absidia glauca TaxID=4829 RepID=A0A163MI38_ABSGL|nr:hypothetical protein [Absidia glauca]